MMIYVAGTPAGPKKVGISQSPESRCAALNNAGLRNMTVLYAREVPAPLARKIEGHAHWLLKDAMKRGEWFSAGLDTVRAAIDAAVAVDGDGEQAKKHVGRKKLWHEAVNLTLPEGAKAKMDSVLEPGEDRLDLIREAIDREVKRRERLSKEPKR